MVIKNFNLRVNSSNYYTQNSKYLLFSVYAYLFSHPITVRVSNLSIFIINLCAYTSCNTLHLLDNLVVLRNIEV